VNPPPDPNVAKNLQRATLCELRHLFSGQVYEAKSLNAGTFSLMRQAMQNLQQGFTLCEMSDFALIILASLSALLVQKKGDDGWTCPGDG